MNRLIGGSFDLLLLYSGDVNNEDSDADGEEQSRTLRQKAERSHLIVWQVFTDS